jgi:hypothetical protein
MVICNPVKWLVVTCLVVGGSVGSLAQGVVRTLSYTNSVSYQPTDWSTSQIYLPKFNSQLGQLQSVVISLQSGLTTTLGITNRSSSASAGQANTILSLNFQNVSLGTEYSGSESGGTTLNYSSAQCLYRLSSGGTLSTGSLTGNSGWVQNTVTNSSVLGGFEGSGNIDFSAGTTTYTSIFNSGGNTAAAQHTTAGLTTVITYDFVPGAPLSTPEPGSLALLGLGVAVFSWRKLARRS